MKKKTKIPILPALGVVLSLVMLFFTFFAWGWFSDYRGLEGYFEIPVNTKDGPLTLFADLLWVAAPFCLLAAFLLLLGKHTWMKLSLSSFLATLPLSLYALLQFLLFLGEKESHFSLFITYFFFLLSAFLTLYACFSPALLPFAASETLFHSVLEVILLIVSVLIGKKISQFYFSQLLPMGKLSSFRFSFFLISIFLYVLAYTLGLALLNWIRLRFLRRVTALETKETPSEEEPTLQAEAEKEPEEESLSEEEESSITLEDLGFER